MSEVSCLGNSIINKVNSLNGCSDSDLVKRTFKICDSILSLCYDCYDEFEFCYDELDKFRGVDANV